MAGKEEGRADNTLMDPTTDLGGRIRASLVFLCKNSTNLHEVIDQLFSHGLLSRRESQVIENEKSDYDRFRQLFIILIPRLGHRDNSKHFVNAFQQSGNKHILEKLKRAVVTTDFVPLQPEASSLGVRFNVREPVPSFFGRTNFLRDLHQEIFPSNRTFADASTNSTIISRICVVTGLGGIGKSETIRKYIHSYGHCYQHVVWIDAQEQNTAENQFRRLALQVLDLSSKDKENNAKDFDVLLKEIYDCLCTKQILLVFDNAEALHDNDSQRTGVSRFLPKYLLPKYFLQPIIIITSRQLDWPDLYSTALLFFTSQESSEFIFRQLKLEVSDANAKDVTTLSETFGALPLALQVAAAVIREESKQNELMGRDVYTIQHLLSDYNAGKREVLKKRPPGSPDAPPLMLLWKVSLDKIRQQPHGHLATQILDVIAHLSPTNIPKKSLSFIFSSIEEKSLKKAVELLVDYSFVQHSLTNFSIHRMLQDVTIAHLDDFETPAVEHVKTSKLLVTPPLRRIMTAVREYWQKMPKSSEAYDAVHDNLIHVTMTHVLPKAQSPLEKDLCFIKFIEFVLHEIKDTRCVEAEKCCRVLITYFTNLAIPSHSASILTSRKFKKVYYFRLQLARILETMGRYKEAVGICKELQSSFSSLNRYRSVHRKDVMSAILATKYSLASILNSQGDHEEAIKLYSSVIDLFTKLYGPTNQSTLTTKNNLALVLQESGRLSEAKTLHAEILEVRIKKLGPLHPSTLTTKHNMARILTEEGHYDDALEMHREVAELWERELGPLHANTLISNSCMADVLQKQGKYDDALRLNAHVISSYEKASAASHPECLRAKNSTAFILGKQGRLDEAKEMFCQVLDIQERLLGPSHKETLKTKHNVADVLAVQGKHSEALKPFEEVLELRTKQLGPTHPNTLNTNEKIGWLHLEMGDFEKAESILKEVLAARQATLPSNNSNSEDIEEI